MRHWSMLLVCFAVYSFSAVMGCDGVSMSSGAKHWYSDDSYSLDYDQDTSSWGNSGGSGNQYNNGSQTPGDTWDSGGTGELPGESCTPNCAGLQCGPDGCGGTCGWCPGELSCQSGLCTEVDGCIPACGGKMVGEPDGCGGVCCGSGLGIGLKPGGAQDASYFWKLVSQGDIPDPKYLPIEGWLNQHDTPLPPPVPEKTMTMHGFAGAFHDPEVGEPVVALQLGLNSAMNLEDLHSGDFNLSFVVDVSGSMDTYDKLPYVKEGLLLLVDQLDETDYVSLVTYATTSQVLFKSQPMTAAARTELKGLITYLYASGGTNLYDGMIDGFEQVKGAVGASGKASPRVILLSDGEANQGPAFSDQGIINGAKPYIAEGIGLTTIGVGVAFNYNLMYLLANQGNGNFFFIDTPAKLVEVFKEEMKYILTPVLENLKVWFRLPPELDVEEIYGFDYGVVDGDYVILAPSAQYTVTPDEEADKPDDSGGVTMSTVFASKKNGLVMVKILAPQVETLATLSENLFATVYYRYTLVETGKEETHSIDVTLDNFVMPAPGETLNYFTSDIIRRNLCVLRIALVMKEACRVYQETPDDGAALQAQLDSMATTGAECKEVFDYLVKANWEDRFVDELFDDLQIIKKLAENITDALPEPEPVEPDPVEPADDVLSQPDDILSFDDAVQADVELESDLSEEEDIVAEPEGDAGGSVDAL